MLREGYRCDQSVVALAGELLVVFLLNPDAGS